MRSRERRAERAVRRAEVDRGDGLGVTGVGIGVVGEHIAGGGRAARAIGNAAFFRGIARIGDSRRRGVRRRTSEDHIGPVVGGAEGVGREDAGGDGSAIGIDAVAAGRGGGGCCQHTAREGGGEEVVGRHIGAGRVVRGDIGGVGGDRDGRGQGHGLPAAGGGVRERHAGEIGSGRRPQVEDVRAGVAGAAIELERGDLAGNGGLELHADFERRAIIQIGLRWRVGRGEEADRRGGCRHGDIEGLAGGEATEIGGRNLDAERADICSRRRAAERACRGVEGQPGGKRRAVGGGRRVGEACRRHRRR